MLDADEVCPVSKQGKPLPKRKPGPKPKVDEQGNLVPKAKPGRKPKLDAEGNRVHPPREPRSKPSPQPDAAPAPRRKGGRPPKTPAGERPVELGLDGQLYASCMPRFVSLLTAAPAWAARVARD